MSPLRRFVAAALIALCAACSPSAPDPEGSCAPDHRGLLAELRQNRTRWDALGASNYQYVFERSCFCPAEVRGPFRVRVQNGAVVGIEPPSSFPAGVLSVTKVFDLVEDAARQRACSIRVSYDPDRRYPADVFIDYSFTIADEETGVRIADLVLLP